MIKYKYSFYAFPILLVVLLPMIFCVYFLVQQRNVKNQMEERLEKSSLTTISILKNNIHWAEQGKEIIVNGELFDVKTITQKNDSLIITGLYDSAEKALKQALASVLGKQKNNNTPLQQLIAQFLSPVILSQNTFELNTIFLFSPQKKYYTLVQNVQCISLDTNTPPPNYIS